MVWNLQALTDSDSRPHPRQVANDSLQSFAPPQVCRERGWHRTWWWYSKSDPGLPAWLMNTRGWCGWMSEEKEVKEKEKSPDDLDAVTQKWGLEAGLWKVRVEKDTSGVGQREQRPHINAMNTLCFQLDVSSHTPDSATRQAPSIQIPADVSSQAFTSKESSTDGRKSAGSQAKDLLARYGSAYLATSISLSLVSFGLCYVLVNNGVDVPAVLEKVSISSLARFETELCGGELWSTFSTSEVLTIGRIQQACRNKHATSRKCDGNIAFFPPVR